MAKGKSHMIIVTKNNTIQIDRINVTRPRSIRPRRSAHLVGAVVDATVDASVDSAADSKVVKRSGAMIIRTKIERMMEMVVKRG